MSSLPYVSRLLEHVVEEQLVTRLDENHLLVKFQSAYHAGFSTETALLQAMNDLLWSMNVVKWFSGSFFNILYLSFFFFCCPIFCSEALLLHHSSRHPYLWPQPFHIVAPPHEVHRRCQMVGGLPPEGDIALLPSHFDGVH